MKPAGNYQFLRGNFYSHKVYEWDSVIKNIMHLYNATKCFLMLCFGNRPSEEKKFGKVRRKEEVQKKKNHKINQKNLKKKKEFQILRQFNLLVCENNIKIVQ